MMGVRNVPRVQQTNRTSYCVSRMKIAKGVRRSDLRAIPPHDATSSHLVSHQNILAEIRPSDGGEE